MSVVVGNETYDVAALNKHNKWNSSDTKNKADIAILVLSKSVNLSESVQPVKIPSNDTITIGEGFVIVLENDERNSTSLTQFSSTALNSTQCIKAFPEAEKLSSDHLFCAEVPQSMCNATEFFYQSSTSGGWTILGISSPEVCDLKLNVSMFTIVGHFEEWISDMIE